MQHLGGKKWISSNQASKHVVIGALQRGQSMEAILSVHCHPFRKKGQAAAGAQMLLARDHFADFLRSLAVIFLPLGI